MRRVGDISISFCGELLARNLRRRQSSRVDQAFILGAGLGTRLRPLTDQLPKPLVPLFHRPLASWALDACAAVGIHRFAINTHHLPGAWDGFAREQGTGISLFHEPVLLETGGGLKNISTWIGEKSLLVHNGDIFSSLPLDKLISAHEASGLPVTLALRTVGDAKHIALDDSRTRVTDIRRRLDRADGSHVFTGIYCIRPGFLDLLPPGEKVSVIPAFLELAVQGLLAAVVLDEGVWLDLGDRDSYLRAHGELALGPAIHPLARIAEGATIIDSVIGPGAVVATGAVVKNSVVWPNCHIATGAVLDRCIVCSGAIVHGVHTGVDI
jgi:NDP-sugar pyrophosphorylase family protein